MTELNVKQEQFINAYLENGNIKATAENIGITEATAHKWLNNGLREIIQSRQETIVHDNMERLVSNYGAVQNELLDLIQDKTQNPRDRLKAIEIYFSQFKVNLEVMGMDSRIRDIDNPLSFHVL